MQTRISAYLRAVTPLGRETQQVGPFLATCSLSTDNPYLNYAIPDDDAAPTPAEITNLVRWYRDRNRKPRLEYLPSVAPAVEPVLAASGFVVEGRLPLMTFDPARPSRAENPSGIVLTKPATDDDLIAMAIVQAEAYASARPDPGQEILLRRAAMDRGAAYLIAWDTATDRVVGAGACSPMVAGITEVASIGVAATHRDRGIGRILAYQLALDAVDRGADVPFLMAAHPAEQRIYERAGFASVGEILHIST